MLETDTTKSSSRNLTSYTPMRRSILMIKMPVIEKLSRCREISMTISREKITSSNKMLRLKSKNLKSSMRKTQTQLRLSKLLMLLIR